MPDWSSPRLEEVAVLDRNRVMPTDLGDEVVHYSIPALDDTGGPVIASSQEIRSQKFAVPEDACLLSLLNPRIPRSTTATGSPTTVCSTEFAVLRPRDPSHLTLSFLSLVVQSRQFSRSLQSLVSGTTGSRQRVKPKQLQSLRIPVPPVEVQRRVVDLIAHLDHTVENARRSTVAARVALDSLRDELEASGDVELGDVADVRSGPSWKAADESTVPSAGSQPVLKITNTRPDGTVDLDEIVYVAGLPDSAMTLTPRSLVAIRTNGNRDRIGNIYMPPPETVGFAVSAFQMIVEVGEHYDRELLYHYLAAPKIQELMSKSASGTTGLGNLAVRWLRKLPVPDPKSEAAEELNSTLETVRATGVYLEQLTTARSAVINGLLSGGRYIPDTYDRFLEEAEVA